MDKGFGLTLARTDLVVGENTRYRLAFTNTGTRPVSFPEFGFLQTWLRFHLKDASGKVSSWSFNDLQDSHEFEPPPMNQTTEVAPGKTQAYEANLAEVIKLPPVGKYLLWAEVAWPEGNASTPQVEVTFRPMSLLTLDIQSTQSGRSPFLNVLWTQSQDKGSAILLSDFMHKPVSMHDHAIVEYRLTGRLHESPFPLNPMIAVPPSASPFPEKWIAWIHDGQLTAFVEEYGKTKVAPFSHPVSGNGLAIRPPLHDPAIGRCDFAFWEAANHQSRLAMFSLRKDGSLAPGPSLPLAAGRLAWSTALYRESRHRIYLLAVERQGQTSLESVTWPKDGASLAHSTLAQFPGSPLAASAFLQNDDGITGAVLSKARHETGAWDYFVHGYSVSPQGAYTARQPVRLSVAKGVEIGRAFVEVGLKGDVIALMESTDGKWYLHASDGAKRKLQVEGDPGTPVGLTWADEAHPRALFWTAQKGFRFVEIAREG